MKRLLAGLIAAALMLCAHCPASGAEYALTDVTFYNTAADTGLNRVFYEIFVCSFSDSDGDGTGDLRGIINRLDYLNDGNPLSGLSLGVEGIWLTPVYLSPSYHKYDISDYYQIDPAFGSLEDLKELIEGCHARGMLLILDLPLNHTGRQNQWFSNFMGAHMTHNPENPWYDFYSWLPSGSPLPAGRRFMNVGKSGIMVEANFSDDMPELNFDNPGTRAALLDVARFYLNMGVDGFRFDAAKYPYFGDHAKNAEFWEWYMERLRALKPDVYAVAEVWDADGVTARYTPAFNCFNFTASQAEGLIAAAARGGSVDKLTKYIEEHSLQLKALNPSAMNVMFIANHDTDRAAGYLTVASFRMQMAANLYLLSPGSPFIYYGEEIGLRGSRGGSNTDANRRLHMLWGDGDTVQDPPGSSYDPEKQSPYSVKELLQSEKGLYSYYKKLLLIRKANPEIAAGSYRALRLEDSKAGGFIATLDQSSVCVLHNSSPKPVRIELNALGEGEFSLISAYIGKGSARIEANTLLIDAQTSVVLR